MAEKSCGRSRGRAPHPTPPPTLPTPPPSQRRMLLLRRYCEGRSPLDEPEAFASRMWLAGSAAFIHAEKVWASRMLVAKARDATTATRKRNAQDALVYELANLPLSQTSS